MAVLVPDVEKEEATVAKCELVNCESDICAIEQQAKFQTGRLLCPIITTEMVGSTEHLSLGQRVLSGGMKLSLLNQGHCSTLSVPKADIYNRRNSSDSGFRTAEEDAESTGCIALQSPCHSCPGSKRNSLEMQSANGGILKPLPSSPFVCPEINSSLDKMNSECSSNLNSAAILEIGAFTSGQTDNDAMRYSNQPDVENAHSCRMNELEAGTLSQESETYLDSVSEVKAQSAMVYKIIIAVLGGWGYVWMHVCVSMQ